MVSQDIEFLFITKHWNLLGNLVHQILNNGNFDISHFLKSFRTRHNNRRFANNCENNCERKNEETSKEMIIY